MSVMLAADTQSTIINLSDNIMMHAAKESFYPLLKDLIGCLNQIPMEILTEHKQKMQEWLIKLNALKVTDSMDEATEKEFLYDLNAAHDSFRKGIAAAEK